MSLPEQLADLLEPDAYPHSCGTIEVVETHISWVILTGEFAYKLKKPVHFSFVDFSTLARREHFCREELRCNRQFAPALYLDVVPVGRRSDGRLELGHRADVVEWAVKMRQFPAEAQLDRLLASGGLNPDMLARFGRRLAAQHQGLPSRRADADELDRRILGPARANFEEIRRLDWTAAHRAVLARARTGTEREAERHRNLFVRRLEGGWTRECHGDLHLSNLVLQDGEVTAFDCLEFNPTLRWIDTQSDVAFLTMDCLVRGRADLAYAFLDGYLDASGDYDGVRLSGFYAGYRSMVRAKVAALRREQARGAAAEALTRRFLEHVAWAADWLERPPGRLMLMCGLSGSGKSFLASRLAPRLPAVRIRSDVARKVQEGLEPLDSARALVGEGAYTRERTNAVYGWLEEVAGDLLSTGENVIVDATFLEAERRRAFFGVAHNMGTDAVIVYCEAPRDVLEARVRARQATAADASDAGLAVLEHQAAGFVPPEQDTIRVDTAVELTESRLEDLLRRLTGARRA